METETVLERDIDRLLQAVKDHRADHGCEGMYGCPIRSAITQAIKTITYYEIEGVPPFNRSRHHLRGCRCV